jgi:lysyl endopeptidase
MKKLSILLATGLLSTSLFGQVTDLGGPMSSNSKVTLHPVVNAVEMASFDLASVIAANAANAAEKIGPFMFGYEHAVSHDLNNSGEWETLNNGSRIWRLKVKSAGALSLNFIFTDFNLPQGGNVYIYTPDKSMVQGAYTYDNNNKSNSLGTELIKGEVAIIEYHEPADQIGVGRLQLGTVVHGYIDINNWFPEKVNESGACNLDVICPDGLPYDLESRSVARILNGGGLCTGTMIADVPQSGTPYFLTADHCGPGSMGSAVFRFNYNSTICGSQSATNSVAPSQNNFINGSSLKANNATSDFGLLELNSIPPVSYNVTFAGWDNSGVIPTSAVGIHHPSGDVKKISFDDDPLTRTAYGGGAGTAEWRIEAWERNTTTEGGSSGSGLWDENNRLVGQLHGGQANCSNSINDYYGALTISWNGSSSANRLKDWLDPQNTGAITMDGYDPNQPQVAVDAGFQGAVSPEAIAYCSGYVDPVVTLKNFGANALISVTISYNVDGGTVGTYNWTGNLNSGATENVTLPTIWFTGSGSHTFNSSTSNPNGTTDGNAVNDDLEVTFSAFPNSGAMFLNLDLDCYGEETGWEINEQGSTDVLFASPVYTNATGGQSIVEEFCLSNGCYDVTFTDTYGDGMYGSQYGGCSVDGNYEIEDYYQNTFVTMTAANADFGSAVTQSFCVDNVGIDEMSLASKVVAYPNPTTGELNVVVNIESTNEILISLMDVRGALVSDVLNANAATPVQMNIKDLPAGVYFLKITSSEGVATKKIIRK